METKFRGKHRESLRMTSQELPGRHIEDVPYTGLVERLLQIMLVCTTAGEAMDHLSKDDLMAFIAKVAELAGEGLVFSCVKDDEAARINKYLIEGMTIAREFPN
jgi:hypothetical protein